MPVVKIIGNKARIHFLVTGPLTHLKVKNCIYGTTACTTENVQLSRPRRKRAISKDVHDFKEDLYLVNPNASAWSFSFWMYQGDTLLTPKPHVVTARRCSCTSSAIPISLIRTNNMNTVYRHINWPRHVSFSRSLWDHLRSSGGCLHCCNYFHHYLWPVGGRMQTKK